ncbi:TetR family transcriptional regulator [Clostridium pasteurianum]|uniref:Transcriptional regulator n=1 Tax=Clostridium pasteurianum BC1 TaxID=86416 RepID=R4K4A8_CLOPA|nr:TetR family transcriptional regulator [Clostridium pasteurianum]AGK96516.1 transcriptional regulator [Clostridium pasteurianum BC1]
MNKDSIDSKSKILKAAKKLFSQNGFDGTSTREIVKEAGVNISLISYYFGSKENVFFSLFDNFNVETNTIDDKGNNINTISKFSSIITQIIKLRFEDPELVTILQQEIIMNSKRTEKFRQVLLPTWIRVKTLLSNGRKEGLFQFKDIDNAISFVMAVAIFPRQNPLFIEFVKKKENKNEIIEEILLFILKGLGFK